MVPWIWFSCLWTNSNIFFLFVIMYDLFKWGTNPIFSDILTSSRSLSQFWPMFPFFYSSNSFVFWYLQGVQKWEHWQWEQWEEWVKGVDQNNFNLLIMIVNSVHLFNSLSLSLSLSLKIKTLPFVLNLWIQDLPWIMSPDLEMNMKILPNKYLQIESQ